MARRGPGGSGNRGGGSPPAWRARPSAGWEASRLGPREFAGDGRLRGAWSRGRLTPLGGEAVAARPRRVAPPRNSCLRFGRLGRSPVWLCPEELPLSWAVVLLYL